MFLEGSTISQTPSLAGVFTSDVAELWVGNYVQNQRLWRENGGTSMDVSWWGSEFMSTGLYDRMQIGPLVWNLCVYWGDLEQISYML